MRGRVDGHGESDPRVAARSAQDLGIYSYDVAVPVEQRATGIARVDGSIGLDDVGIDVAAGTSGNRQTQSTDQPPVMLNS